MDELGPIRTLICGSSVMTVMNIPVEAGVTVGCWARTTVEEDAKKNAQRENRAIEMTISVGRNQNRFIS